MAKDPGEYAQDKVAECFRNLKKKNLMVFERIKDAKSSSYRNEQGRTVSRGKKELADFMLWYKKTSLAFEIKEVKHDSRIATSRLTQLPKMRIFGLTGNLAVVLVWHSTNKVWRWFDLEFAIANKGSASYDLSGHETFKNVLAVWQDIQSKMFEEN